MADQTAHDLAELVTHVFSPLPRDAVARPLGAGTIGSQLVTLKRRDSDRYLVTWRVSAPVPGENVELQVARDQAVYALAAQVTGIDRDNARFLTITELRRRRQRRNAERAAVDDLVMISHDGDVDGTLIDISTDGLAFQLDRPLPVEATIKAVLNFQGTVIPTTAQVRSNHQTSDGAYRIGCAILVIADQHRHAIQRYAADHALDRRSRHGRSLLQRLRTHPPIA
jgi:hypothetical protein